MRDLNMTEVQEVTGGEAVDPLFANAQTGSFSTEDDNDIPTRVINTMPPGGY